MRPENYFDNAATTRPDPRVVGEMLPYLDSCWGNAHSIHAWGREAKQGVDLARERVAALLGAEDPSEIAFTSGATESNNWVLRAYSGEISPFEHSSVRWASCDSSHKVLSNQDYLVGEPDPECELVSVMTVNNETGAVVKLPYVPSGCLIHRDITQAVGKLPVDLAECHFASMSAHKFHGPKGVGALYARDAAFPEALLRGGEQEHLGRSGTLNVPGIVGMGVAAEIAAQERKGRYDHASLLKSTLLGSLDGLSDWQENGGEQASPFIVSISFAGIEGEALVVEADSRGFGISSGAACSQGRNEPSHVLTALAVPDKLIRGTVRVSFSFSNSESSTVQLARCLKEIVEKLRSSRNEP